MPEEELQQVAKESQSFPQWLGDYIEYRRRPSTLTPFEYRLMSQPTEKKVQQVLHSVCLYCQVQDRLVDKGLFKPKLFCLLRLMSQPTRFKVQQVVLRRSSTHIARLRVPIQCQFCQVQSDAHRTSASLDPEWPVLWTCVCPKPKAELFHWQGSQVFADNDT